MFSLGLAASVAAAADYRTPAESRPAVKRPGGESILPGGRMLSPLGRQHQTGFGPWALAVSPNGKRVLTLDGGRSSGLALTTVESRADGWKTDHFEPEAESGSTATAAGDDPQSTFIGLAFEGNDDAYASDGASGLVRLLDASSGKRKAFIDLNTNEFKNSYAGDLALDTRRNLLYVVDPANFRLAVIDTRRRRIVANVRTGRQPSAVALSPDGKRAYVTSLGVFDYGSLAGGTAGPSDHGSPDVLLNSFRMASPAQAAGHAHIREASSLLVIDVENTGQPRPIRFIPVSLPYRKGFPAHGSPAGVAADASRIFVANGRNDSVTVINAQTLEVQQEIRIRIPGLEELRGILPTSLAVEGETLYVAEAGINAVGVIDLRTSTVKAHLPAGWCPTRVVARDGTLYVANAKGNGIGPTASQTKPYDNSYIAGQRRGTVSIYPAPDPDDFAKHTARVYQLNGLAPRKEPAAAIPGDVQHVVLIVKGSRTFDDIFGDLVSASNAPVNGAWDLARFGQYAVIGSGPGELRQRFAMRNVPVTPNHHAAAGQFAIGDNFYADGDVLADGHHRLVGGDENAWTEQALLAAYGGEKGFRVPSATPGKALLAGKDGGLGPENADPREQLQIGALWRHLDRHNVPFRRFGEGPGGVPANEPGTGALHRNTSRDYPSSSMDIPDQTRANQLIREMERRYIAGKEPLPRFLYIHLPNDQAFRARPEDGYPFSASFVADNDYALGRILEFLSKGPWWKQTAVFVTEDDARGGYDHVDGHRTVLLAAGPYVKRNYVTKTNASFPGLLKTILRLLDLPPLSLFDATAADLDDLFTAEADLTPFAARPTRPELFDPTKVRDVLKQPKQ